MTLIRIFWHSKIRGLRKADQTRRDDIMARTGNLRDCPGFVRAGIAPYTRSEQYNLRHIELNFLKCRSLAKAIKESAIRLCEQKIRL